MGAFYRLNNKKQEIVSATLQHGSLLIRVQVELGHFRPVLADDDKIGQNAIVSTNPSKETLKK